MNKSVNCLDMHLKIINNNKQYILNISGKSIIKS